jgi:hypothetical protein
VLLFVAVTVPAIAWEFSMTGEHDYRWRYWARTGNNDLFGLAGAQETTGAYVGFAGPNYWGNGANPGITAMAPLPAGNMFITRGGFSQWGSDGLYVDQRLTFVPEIRVNQAVRVHGTYNVGGIRNMFNMSAGGVGFPPFERYMAIHTQNSASVSTAGIGSWEQVRATAQLPFAILSYGMKDFSLGFGTFTTQRLRGSAFVAVIPYGPFRFIPAIWDGSSFTNGTGTYNYRPDGTNKNNWFAGLLFTYDQGDFSFGGGYMSRNVHRTAIQGNPAAVGPVSLGLGYDDILNLSLWYTKYFNGRFFIDAEYAWYAQSYYYIKSMGGNTPPAPPNAFWGVPGNFSEGYHLMMDMGMIAGPAKATLFWAQSSGPVLNDNSGYWGQALGYVGSPAGQGRNPNLISGYNPKTYVPWGLDFQALNPYQYLMFGVYAGGNQTFAGLFLPDDGKGMMSDAYAFAGRLDYAVASNLNVYGTYMWAHRLEAAGTFMGQYSNLGNAGGIATVAERQNFRQNAGAAIDQFERYVPDGHIGWEVNLGMDWKLLEGLTVRGRYAYWQPGNWFNYAYQAVMPGQVAGSQTLNSGNAFTYNGFLGVRDAIQAFEGSLTIDF